MNDLNQVLGKSLQLQSMQRPMLAGFRLSKGTQELEQVVWRIKGHLDIEGLVKAWEHAAAHFEALRVDFDFSVGDSWIQTIRPEVKISIVDIEKKEVESRRAATLHDFLTADRGSELILTEAPVWRLSLLRFSDEDSALVWTFPHVILDGRSISAVLVFVARCYRGEVNQLTSSASLDEYLEWRSGLDHRASLSWWKQQLSGCARAPVFPKGSGGKEECFSLDHVISGDLLDRLKGTAGDAQVSLNNLVQVAWALVLSSLSGTSDLAFGVVRSCRFRGNERLVGLAGMFANAVPLRVVLEPTETLETLLRRVRRIQTETRAHELVPLEEIQKVSGLPDGERLFSTMLSFDHESVFDAAAKILGPGHQFSIFESPSAPVVLSVTSGQVLRFRLYAMDSVMSPPTAHRTLEQVERALTALVDRLDSEVRSVELISQADRLRTVTFYNATEVKYPTGNCLHHAFERVAARFPSLSAVVGADRELSYGELDSEANCLANLMLARGAKPRGLVVIRLEKSSRLIVAMMAALKIGCGYVPVDPNWPEDRLKFILESTKPQAFISSSEHLRLGFEYEKLFLWDVNASELADCSARSPNIIVDESEIAYVIFTSGSTGTPKGVVIDHRGVVNTLIDCNRQYSVGVTDRAFCISQCTFDLSVYDIFGMLSVGASLVVCPSDCSRDPETWGRLIQDHKVTIWNSVPQLAEMLFETNKGSPRIFDTLRLVMLSGDWIPVSLPDRIRSVVPRVEIWSLGGATEVSIWSIWRPIHYVCPSWTSIPYGRPMGNQTLFVLDEHLHPCPTFVQGDLYIGGVGLAKGYWSDPDRTAAAFITHPRWGIRLYRTGDRARFMESGELEFLGRKDNQVKLGGFRIELGEIESAIGSLPSIKEVVVAKRELGTGAEGLVAYFVIKSGEAPTLEQLRAHCRSRLPEYMLPSVSVQMKCMPLSANGKVDRKALPAPQITRPSLSQFPWTSSEKSMADIWEKVLGVRPDSPHRSFFDCGGNSLLAIRLIEAVSQETGKKIRLADIFQQRPTLHQLTEMLSLGSVSVRKYELPEWFIPIRSEGSKPPFFFIGDFLDVGRYFAEDQPFYGLMIGVDIRGLPDYRDVSFSELAARAVAAIRSVQPQGPYHLSGYCFGGALALEIAAQLQSLGEKIAYLGFLEPPTSPKFSVPKRPARFYGHLLVHKLRHLPDTIKHFRVMSKRKKEFAALMKSFNFPNGDPFWDYTPAKLNVPIDFFLCRGSSYRLLPEYDPRRGWYGLASTIYEEEVSGDHHTVLRAPHIIDVARAIEHRLNQVQEKGK